MTKCRFCNYNGKKIILHSVWYAGTDYEQTDELILCPHHEEVVMILLKETAWQEITMLKEERDK